MAKQSIRHILCMNSGSSSLKFHVYRMGDDEQVLLRGAVQDIAQEDGRLWFVDGDGRSIVQRPLGKIDHETAIEEALCELDRTGLPPLDAIGHRMVHGGPKHLAPELLTPGLLEDLRRHIPWAPLHLPASLMVVAVLSAHYPDLPQVACFDTSFHAGMPEVARRLPLPTSFHEEGIRRYGFHGLSYEYILGALGDEGVGRLVMAHLGNGASMVACLDGRPLDTTMGMTPLGGFMMGTRTGDLDPGVPLYLVRERGYDDKSLERLLDKGSGLKGVSGLSGDMQTLLESRDTHQGAALAVEMFCYQARKTVGALAAVLGGLDTLVFTGGIGEHAAPVRAEICGGLKHLGLELDQVQNDAHAAIISTAQSTCVVRVMHTSEDLTIARHTCALVYHQGESDGQQLTGA